MDVLFCPYYLINRTKAERQGQNAWGVGITRGLAGRSAWATLAPIRVVTVSSRRRSRRRVCGAGCRRQPQSSPRGPASEQSRQISASGELPAPPVKHLKKGTGIGYTECKGIGPNPWPGNSSIKKIRAGPTGFGGVEVKTAAGTIRQTQTVRRIGAGAKPC